MTMQVLAAISVGILGSCSIGAARAGPPPPQSQADLTLRDFRMTEDRDGTVLLSGRADTQAAADRAVQIARRSQGVKSVTSHITVTSRPKR